MRTAPFAVAIAVAIGMGIGGCGHHPEILRLQLEFREVLQRGDLERASEIERDVTALAAEDYGPEDPSTIRLRADLIQGYGSALQTEHALSMAREEAQAIEARHGPDSSLVFPSRFAKAWTLVFARRWKDAEHEVNALAADCHRFESRSLEPSPCFHALDELLQAVGACERANAEFLRVDGLGLLRDDRRGAVSVLTKVARRYMEFGRLPEARWYLRRCIEETGLRPPRPDARRSVWSTDSGDVSILTIDSAHAFDSQAPRCLDDLILVEHRTGNEEKALELERERSALWKRGPDLESMLQERLAHTQQAWQSDNLTTTDLNTLAWYYLGKERLSDAIATWKDADHRLQRLRASDGRHPHVGMASRHVDILLGLAQACERQGRPDEAAEAYRRAAEIADAQMHPAHAWRLEAVAGLAAMQQQQGFCAQAEASWRRHLAIAVDVRGVEHAEYARGLAGLADAREPQGHRIEARTLRERSARVLGAYARRMDAARNLPLPAALRSPPSPANYPPTETPAAPP